MIWNFIRKHWFSVALVLILLAAIFRKNLRINVGDTAAPAKQEQPEKFTKEPVATTSGPSLLGLNSENAASPVRLPEIDDPTAVAFLKRFGQVAVGEQKKFGMPASVLLGCAYVNSFGGRRDCATGANNYLAVPCTAEWGGPVASYSGACFRKYNTAWESIRDFNIRLSQSNWYGPLKKKAKLDWRAWAKGLARNRVSDVENFEEELVKVIGHYRLFELD